jgi:Cu/Zn superoxide dismutase
MRDVRPLPILLATLLTLAGCSSTSSMDPRTWFSKENVAAPKEREVPGVDAPLRPITSNANGRVRLRESGDLLVVSVELWNLNPGSHRVVLHSNGNCSSPNGFSAGAPWSPPGWKESPTRLIPEVTANSSGNATMVARVRGVRLGDAVKRSVLVYQGTTPQQPQPDTPNNVVACGVFEQATTLF